MKTKILCLLLLIPILLVLITFTASSSIKLPIEAVVENLILEHNGKEAVTLNEPFKLYAYKIPNIAKGNIKWWTSNEDIAYVKDGYLHSKQEGVVEVFASMEDGSFVRSFKAYVCAESDTPRYVIVNNELDSKNGISSEYYFGEYDFKKGDKVASKLTLDVSVLPLNVNQDVIFEFSNDNAHDENGSIVIDKPGLVEIKIKSKEDNSIYDEYSFNVVDEGVNIYSYDDLLNATTRSNEGEIAVMQTSLESKENAYLSGDKLLPNTKVLGLGEGNRLKFEYDTFESTYDTQYLKNTGMDTKLKIAINIKKDIYGNGFTINLHNLAYPSKVESGTKKPITSNDDLFKGPLPFVNVMGFVISGQDNIGFAVTKPNVTIQNINLRNSNFVNDLTHLDYVGTVLEIMDGANNVTVKDSIISNGRTVVRTFSNTGFTIENCLLQYAREFILKLGSNTILKPTPNQVLPQGHNELYKFLSPLPKVLENGEYESDSSCTVKDTYFYKSGFFSIGFDTHFAGELLYNGKYSGVDMSTSGVYGLCGTSLPSTLKLTGDCRLYDWKKVGELDSSSLIQVTLPDLDIDKYFDVAQMIKNKVVGTNFYYQEGDDIAVHGGIAFFGGGRNLSKIIFENELENSFSNIGAPINDPAFGSGGQVLVHAAGYGEFKFYLYTKDTVNNYYLELPNIDNLKR